MQILGDMNSYIARQLTIPTQIANSLVGSIRQANQAMTREVEVAYEDWKVANQQLVTSNQNLATSLQRQGDLERTCAELVNRVTMAEAKITETEKRLSKMNDDLLAALRIRAELEAELASRKADAERQNMIIKDLHEKLKQRK